MIAIVEKNSTNNGDRWNVRVIDALLGCVESMRYHLTHWETLWCINISYGTIKFTALLNMYAIHDTAQNKCTAMYLEIICSLLMRKFRLWITLLQTHSVDFLYIQSEWNKILLNTIKWYGIRFAWATFLPTQWCESWTPILRPNPVNYYSVKHDKCEV